MGRIIQNLNGTDWKFQCFKDGDGIKEIFSASNHDDWMDASIPGNVRLDLMQNGKIEDPYYGQNNKNSQWVNEYEWWYKKEFELQIDAINPQNKILQLVFKAVDYVAEFWLNGRNLGTHEGMFGKITFEVTDIIQNKNVLLVRLAAIKNFPNRFEVIKCQMSYGWDWAPKMITSGIWNDVFLEITEKIHINSLFIRSTVDNKGLAKIKITLDIQNQKGNCMITLITKLKGDNFPSDALTTDHQFELKSGNNELTYIITIENPMLWYPWDKGTPNLYQCEIQMLLNDDIIDHISDRFGIRKFQLLAQNLNPEHYPWIFEINGEREYIRGANWVPADMLFGRLDRERYEKNVKLAKEANINLIRVWGGGIIDKDEFFQVCDEEGILVWQEFPIACVFTNMLPTDAHYLEVLKNEAESIVKACRNHPCILLWCGGNEFHSTTNDHVVKVLQNAVAQYDERTFIPASPEGGDSHSYAVFHGLGPYTLYLEDEYPLVSEFGLSSFPNYSTLKKYVPENELFFWSSTVDYRAPHVIFFQGHKLRMQRYALPFSPTDDLSAIIQASQQGQGLGLKIAIEHYRRRKLDWQTVGCGIWQLNQPWPCISWCIFEYDYEKKLSFEYVRTAFQPVLISLKYDLECDFRKHHTLNAQVFLVNDYTRKYPGCSLQIQFLTQDNVPIHSIERVVDVPEDTCIELDPLIYEIPPNLAHPPKIRIKLLFNNTVVSRNFYNLRYFDPFRNKSMGRLMKRASDIMMYDKSSRIVRLLKTGAIALCIIPLFIYLALKIKIKWRRRPKSFFEYEDTDYLKENPF